MKTKFYLSYTIKSLIGVTILLTMTYLVCNLVQFNFTYSTHINYPQLTFLGAILEPLNLDKRNSQNDFYLTQKKITDLTNQTNSVRINTAPTKPKLSANIKNKRKIFFKLPPEIKETPQSKPSNILTEINNNQSSQKPYQRLKLYP